MPAAGKRNQTQLITDPRKQREMGKIKDENITAPKRGKLEEEYEIKKGAI